VHLEDVRCSGQAHGGCQARCLMFWKEQWLEKESGAQLQPDGTQPVQPHNTQVGCTELDLTAGTQGPTGHPASEPVYICQSTQLFQATQALPWWDLRQYVEDYTSRNVRLSQLLASLVSFLCARIVSAGLGLGAGLVWLYDAIQKLRGGTPYPWRVGTIPRGAKTPSAKLDLQPGELVRIRSYQEILTTIDETGHNRGMVFDAEMVPYCGGTYRVLDRVNRIINEKTGQMQHLKNACIVLDEVVCLAKYAKCRRFCPRQIYPYWREIWLDRTETDGSVSEANASSNLAELADRGK
jgi:hypothetical protein